MKKKKRKKKTIDQEFFLSNPSKIIDRRRRRVRDVYFKRIGCGGKDRGSKRNETVRSTFPVIAIQFPFQPAACATCRPANPRGNGLKQFLRSKQIFYRCIPKPVCTFEREFYFGVSLLERGRGRDREQKGRQEFSSRSLPPPVHHRSENSFKMDPDLSGGGLD